MFGGEQRSIGEIQKADPDARRRALLAVVVLALVGAAAVWLFQKKMDGLTVIAERDPAAAVDALAGMVGWLSAGFCLPLLGFAGYGLHLAYRISRSRRFPPPGMAVIRDTPILNGVAAVTRARLLAALMVLLAISAVALPVALTRVVETLAEAVERNPGGGRGGGRFPSPASNIVEHKGGGSTPRSLAANRNPKNRGRGN